MSAEKSVKIAEEIRNRLNRAETERSQLKSKLAELQKSKIEAENVVMFFFRKSLNVSYTEI